MKPLSLLKRWVLGPNVVARREGNDFTVRLVGRRRGFATLVATRRGGHPPLRIDPDLSRSNALWTTFALPFNHLLPRSVAQTTLDLAVERRGKPKRLKYPRGYRAEPISLAGVRAHPYATVHGNFSVAVVRGEARPPLRVVVLLHQLNFSGGKTTMLFTLAGVLESAGFDVALTPFWLSSTPMVYQPPEEIRLDSIDSQMNQAPGEATFSLQPPNFSASERTIERLKTYFSSIDADVIYMPDYDSSLYELVLDSLPDRVLSILGDHNGGRYGAAVSQGQVPRANERNRHFHAAIQRFDAIHVINPTVQAAYEASTAKPVFCIPNFAGNASAAGADFLAHRRVIAAGRLTPVKHFDLVIRAFSALRAKHEAWTLDIYGRGEDEQRLRELIAELRLERFVTIHAPTTAILDEMRASSFHVTASTMESYGMTIAEAMSVGLPVASHRSNVGAGYLLAEGRGFIAEESTIPSLTKLMDSLMSSIEGGDADGSLRATAEAAHGFVSQFSSEAIASRWRSEIHRLYDRKVARLYG